MRNQINIPTFPLLFNLRPSSWASRCRVKAHAAWWCSALPLCSHRLRYAQCAIITESLSGFSGDSQTVHTLKASFLMLISLQTFPPAPLSHPPSKPGRMHSSPLPACTAANDGAAVNCTWPLLGSRDTTSKA